MTANPLRKKKRQQEVNTKPDATVHRPISSDTDATASRMATTSADASHGARAYVASLIIHFLFLWGQNMTVAPVLKGPLHLPRRTQQIYSFRVRKPEQVSALWSSGNCPSQKGNLWVLPPRRLIKSEIRSVYCAIHIPNDEIPNRRLSLLSLTGTTCVYASIYSSQLLSKSLNDLWQF